MLTSKDISQIKKVVKTEIKNEIDPFRKEVRTEFNQINKKLDKSIDFLDRDYIKLLKRVERIEEHLNLPPATS